VLPVEAVLPLDAELPVAAPEEELELPLDSVAASWPASLGTAMRLPTIIVVDKLLLPVVLVVGVEWFPLPDEEGIAMRLPTTPWEELLLFPSAAASGAPVVLLVPHPT
jgi:hypothetical protein